MLTEGFSALEMYLLLLSLLGVIFIWWNLYSVAHGTYIGNIRLEAKKPQQVPLDSEIHFGASTRIYIIRERPQPVGPGGLDEDGTKQSEKEGNLLGLPESETELDVSNLRCVQPANLLVFIANPLPPPKQK